MHDTACLKIPTPPWDPADFTTSSVRAALGLASQLTDPDVTLGRLDVRAKAPQPVHFGTSHISSEVDYSVRKRRVAIKVRVDVGLADSDGVELATIGITATSRAGPLDRGFDDWDALDTFVSCIGVLDPLDVAMAAIESGIRALGDNARVVVDDAGRSNLHELIRANDLPPMDSERALPLNPFALMGVSGAEAVQWDVLGFAASAAEPWVSAGITPVDAAGWSAAEFSAAEAVAWGSTGADAEQARRLRRDGRRPSDVADAPGEVRSRS